MGFDIYNVLISRVLRRGPRRRHVQPFSPFLISLSPTRIFRLFRVSVFLFFLFARPNEK